MTESRTGKVAEAFWLDERGVASIEYALLAALIFGAIAASFGLLSDSVLEIYMDVADKVANATS